MNIVAADWLPYRLPLKRPWTTSRGQLCERRGKLLRLRTADGRLGWGDCAPWPEFGIDQAMAVAFAEECATLDLAAQAADLPLDAWLSGRAGQTWLAVNANLGSLDGLGAERVQAGLTAGFRVLKLKVGVLPWREEIARLQALSRHLPADASWRLDANGAWSEAEAGAFIRAAGDLPIESLEEPLRQPLPPQLAQLQAQAGFPLAIDESLPLLAADLDFFRQPPVRRMVLKPARHGGLLASLAIALRAAAGGMDCVVTSSLESTCGLLACAHLAAVVAPRATHGLATAEWLAEDTGPPPAIRQGRLYLPGRPGMGFVSGS